MLIPVGDNVQSKTFPIMPIVLIVINVFVYAFQDRAIADAESVREVIKIQRDYMETWALVPANLEKGEIIGVITHAFMHGGWGHLIGNMFFLWAFSQSLEAVVGRWTLLGFYVLFGVAGGLAYACGDLSSTIPLVGASGAIAGFMGAYLVVFGLKSRIKLIFFLLLIPIRFSWPSIAFIMLWFGMQVFYSEMDVTGESGVAWYAHIGGFLCGALIMKICQNDTDAEVVLDGHGNVVVEDHEATFVREQAEARYLERQLTAPETMYAVPNACSACGTEVGMEHATEGLLRCPNEGCQKITFLEYSEPAQV